MPLLLVPLEPGYQGRDEIDLVAGARLFEQVPDVGARRAEGDACRSAMVVADRPVASSPATAASARLRPYNSAAACAARASRHFGARATTTTAASNAKPCRLGRGAASTR